MFSPTSGLDFKKTTSFERSPNRHEVMTRASRTTKKVAATPPETTKEVASGTKVERGMSKRSIGTRATKVSQELDESPKNGINKRKSTPISGNNSKNNEESAPFSPELDTRGRNRGAYKGTETPLADANIERIMSSGSKRNSPGIKIQTTKNLKKLAEPMTSDIKTMDKISSYPTQEKIGSSSKHVKKDISSAEESPKEPVASSIFGSIKDFIGKAFMSSSKNDVKLSTEAINSTDPLFTEDVKFDYVDFDQMKYKELQQYIKKKNIKIKHGAKSKSDLIDAIKEFENAKSPLLQVNSTHTESSLLPVESNNESNSESGNKIVSGKCHDIQLKETEPVKISVSESSPKSLKVPSILVTNENRKDLLNNCLSSNSNGNENLFQKVHSENLDIGLVDIDPIRNIALDAMSKVKCGDEVYQHEITAMKLYADRNLSGVSVGSVITKSASVDSSNLIGPLSDASPYNSNTISLQHHYNPNLSKRNEGDRRLSYEGGWKSRESFLPSPSITYPEERVYTGSASNSVNTKSLIVPLSTATNNYASHQSNLIFHNYTSRNTPHYTQNTTPLMTNNSLTHTHTYYSASKPYYGTSVNNITTAVPLYVSPMNTYLPLSSTIGKKRNAEVSINQQSTYTDYKRPRLPEDFKNFDKNSIINRSSLNLKSTFEFTPSIVTNPIKSLQSTPFSLSAKTVENITPKSSASLNTDISCTSNSKSSLSFMERRRLLRAKSGKSISTNVPPTGTAQLIIEAISETRNEVTVTPPILVNPTKSSTSNTIDICSSNSRSEKDIKLMPISTNNVNMKLVKSIDNSDGSIGKTNIKPSFSTTGLNVAPNTLTTSFSVAKVSKDEDHPKLLPFSSSDLAPASIMKRTESTGKSVTFEVLPQKSVCSIETSTTSNGNDMASLNKIVPPVTVNPIKVEHGISQNINVQGRTSNKSNEEFEFGSPILIDGVNNSSHDVSSTDIKFMFSPPKSHLKQKATPIKTPTISQGPQIVGTNTNTTTPVQVTSKTVTNLTTNKPNTIDLWALAAKNDNVKCQSCLVANAKGAVKCASCEAEICNECKLLSYDPNDKKCKNKSCKGPVGGNQKLKTEVSSTSSSIPDWATQPVKVSTVSTGPFTFGIPASTPTQNLTTSGPFTVTNTDIKPTPTSTNNMGFTFAVDSNKEKEEGLAIKSSTTNSSANPVDAIPSFTSVTANNPLLSLATPKISNPTFGVTSNSTNNSSFKSYTSSGSLTTTNSATTGVTTPFKFGGSSVESTKPVSLLDSSNAPVPFKFGVSGTEPSKTVIDLPDANNSKPSSSSAAIVPFTVKTESTSLPSSYLNATTDTTVAGPFSFAPAKSVDNVKTNQTNSTSTAPFVFSGGLQTTQFASNPVASTAKERTNSHGSDSPNSRMDMDGDSPHIVSAALNTSSSFIIPPALSSSSAAALFTTGTNAQTASSFPGINNSNSSSNIFNSTATPFTAFSSATPTNPVVFGASNLQSSSLSFGTNLPGVGSQLVPGIAFGNQSMSSIGSTSNQQLLHPSSSNGSISDFGSSGGSNIFSIGTAPKEGERKILKAKKPNRS